jgi:selenocysteine lyase/cysteine desulfurase
MSLKLFRESLHTVEFIEKLRSGLIGEGVKIPGLIDEVRLVYADYVASGRALTQIENYIAEHVLPFYANSHTEASFCGKFMTQLRAEGRAEISRLTHADEECSVIFTGAGATAGLNRLVTLFGINEANHPVVFIGPYEHHSNILPWRESNAEVVEIPEDSMGGPDLEFLSEALEEYKDSDLKIGSFSIASNVTGIITQPDEVTRLLKKHDALSIWDYAGGGPYMPINMSNNSEMEKDAVVVSPHKFIGGPGASGVLILRNNKVKSTKPTSPGGGTVTFVSPWQHEYIDDLASREEAGTPNVIGDIRAALAFIVKDVVGQDYITKRESELNIAAISGWKTNRQLKLLGAEHKHRLPIFSFLVLRSDGSSMHQQLFTRMLSDVYGIQARGGCACAGPYAHRLLSIDCAESQKLFTEIQKGNEIQKPGWVRLNFSYLMSDETVSYIINSVNELTQRMETFSERYEVDISTARFKISNKPSASNMYEKH